MYILYVFKKGNFYLINREKVRNFIKVLRVLRSPARGVFDTFLKFVFFWFYRPVEETYMLSELEKQTKLTLKINKNQDLDWKSRNRSFSETPCVIWVNRLMYFKDTRMIKNIS